MTQFSKELVIFDFDGTLADTKEIAYTVYTEMARKHDIELVSKVELERIMTLPILERLKYFNVPLRKIPRLAKEAIRRIENHIEYAPIYPKVKETLEYLRDANFLLYVISSNSKKNINHFLESYNLTVFEKVIGKASLFGKAKVIDKLIKSKKIAKDQAIYVGDEVRDIEASKQAGVDVIAVSWGYDSYEALKDANPTFLVKEISEIKEIIQK